MANGTKTQGISKAKAEHPTKRSSVNGWHIGIGRNYKKRQNEIRATTDGMM